MACISKRRGRWVIDFYDHQGKRRWKTLPEGSTKKKARDAMREIEDQISRGIYLPDPEIPTFKKVAEDWLKHKKPSVRSSTLYVYEGHTRNHFADFDNIKINRINVAKIENFITDRQNDGMHILTLRKILVTFGQIMSFAARRGFIAYNPFHDAERPKGRAASKSTNILSPAEIKKFLDATTDHKYRTLFMLAIMSGARQGELLGLKWSDLDREKNQIHIRRTFNNQEWFEPKTETSTRKIDLGPAMVAALKKWKVACPPNRLNLIFPNEAGQPLNHNNMVTRYFEPALEKAKVTRKVRFHDLRHTYASLLIEQGENIKYIQTQLGHSSPTVTLNVYSHLMKETNQEAATRYENAIFQPTGSKMVAGN